MRTLALVPLLALGCSTQLPVHVVASPSPRPARPAIQIAGELGGMNEAAVASAFGRLERQVIRCIETGAGHVGELGGHFEIALRIDPEGKARWAYVGASTLGHRATEKCIAEAARGHTWPQPVGGDGLASRAFDIEPGVPSISWSEKRVKGAVRAAAQKLGGCRGGAQGAFLVTAYVRPDGRVLASGVAPPSAKDEEAADCLAKVIEPLRFPSPGRKTAKVTFELP